MSRHVRSLPQGPLAIIGDIHGENDALTSLLGHLDAHHPDHHLVFLGDLADRGPDSPGVIRQVRARVEAGADCVLGNHELSVLRGTPKGYNQWFFTDEPAWRPKELVGDDPVPMIPLPVSERSSVVDFFASMPLALEREDVRVVHACWDAASIDTLRHDDRSALALYEALNSGANPRPKPAALTEKTTRLASRDTAWEAFEERRQNTNPVAVLTSGKERSGTDDEVVWSGNQWRPLVRDRWWTRYTDSAAVVIGHYSRMWHPEHINDKTRLMFGDASAGAPLGPRRNVYCIDYAVGTRFDDRHAGHSPRGRLAALLWHDDGSAELLFDDGERVTTPRWPATPE